MFFKVTRCCISIALGLLGLVLITLGVSYISIAFGIYVLRCILSMVAGFGLLFVAYRIWPKDVPL
jgi:hypothetical protein